MTTTRSAQRRRVYLRPVLNKGPVLAQVTAQSDGKVSGLSDSTPCWVARAAFGDGDVRWMIFRDWLMKDAPVWFRTLYIRHGKSVGAWIVPHPSVRAAVRAAMLPAIRRRAGL